MSLIPPPHPGNTISGRTIEEVRLFTEYMCTSLEADPLHIIN